MNKTETKIYAKLEDKLKAARVIFSNARLASVNHDLLPAHILPQYITSFKQFRTDKRSICVRRDKIKWNVDSNFATLENRMRVFNCRTPTPSASSLPPFASIRYCLYTLDLLRIQLDVATGKVCNIRINLSGEYAETKTTLSRLRMCLQFIRANFSLASYEVSRISYTKGKVYWYFVKDKQWINVVNRWYVDGLLIFDNTPLDEDYYILRNSEPYVENVVTNKQIIEKLEHRAFNITCLGE